MGWFEGNGDAITAHKLLLLSLSSYSEKLLAPPKRKSSSLFEQVNAFRFVHSQAPLAVLGITARENVVSLSSLIRAFASATLGITQKPAEPSSTWLRGLGQSQDLVVAQLVA